MRCQCLNDGIVEVIGLCDPEKITFITDPADPLYLFDRNWTEISIPETLCIPEEKPNIERINKIFIKVKILSKKVVDTPIPNPVTTMNQEGTLLTGKKLVVEGVLLQKIVYTADVPQQTVHSASFAIPFSAFIILYPNAEGEFCVDVCVEDVFIKLLDSRQIFKNVTLFLRARPKPTCP